MPNWTHNKPDRKLPLRSQVVTILKAAILSFRLAPGTILNERELAQQLGVSKTPIREALSLLNHEGLVSILPRQAYIVSQISVRDVIECFNLRVILEGAAAELAAARITDAELNELETIVAGETADETIAEGVDRNVSLHSAIARASGNERLLGLIQNLLAEMPRMITAGYDVGEHEQVMKALRDRDSIRAREAICEHILKIKEKALGAAGSTQFWASIPTDKLPFGQRLGESVTKSKAIDKLATIQADAVRANTTTLPNEVHR